MLNNIPDKNKGRMLPFLDNSQIKINNEINPLVIMYKPTNIHQIVIYDTFAFFLLSKPKQY